MKTAILYHKELERYSFGQGHPLCADRFERFLSFFSSRCPSYKSSFKLIEPEPVTDEILELVHSRDYITAISQASEGKILPDISRYVSADNLNPTTGYVPLGIEKGARIIVGISLSAGELLLEEESKNTIGIGGGMHHAKPDYGEGFCFYNDVAICINNLRHRYNLKRILVLDTDAHAGNGTKEIFYHDPEVLFIDIHQDPRTLYPGTGFISEIGSGTGEGFTVNLPLLPGASNEAYRYLFQEIIFPLSDEFKPQVIIRYGGSDPHYLDKLTNLGLTLEGFRMIGQQVRDISRQHTQGKSIDLMLSGYNLTVLPFAWSALISGLLDIEVDLTGLREETAPSIDSRLKETKQMVEELKEYLKRYWRCMN